MQFCECVYVYVYVRVRVSVSVSVFVFLCVRACVCVCMYMRSYKRATKGRALKCKQNLQNDRGGGVGKRDRGTQKRSRKVRVRVCCSVLQCVAVCCSVLQCVAVCCSVLKLTI